MLTLQINKNTDNPEYGQRMQAPAIYLDHWAFMDIASSPQNCRRLAQLVKEKNGTLAISMINLLELSIASSKFPLRLAEELLDVIFPHLYFIEMNPTKVIEKENLNLKNLRPVPPHQDAELLKHFAYNQPQDSLNPLSMKGLLNNIDMPAVQILCKEFMSSLDEKVAKLRQKRLLDKSYFKRVGAIPTGPDIQRATRYIFEDILNSLIRGDIKLTSNHWRDFFHTIVPLSYCNVVLLDKTWAHKANETTKRLRMYGYKAEIAQVFWAGEIDKFWQFLEDYKEV